MYDEEVQSGGSYILLHN